MNYEVDENLFREKAEWCVYLHSRPDGEVFYVGKGRRRRAHDFAPSRRTLHHANIVKKHGRANIGIKVIPCTSEIEANMLERAHISMWRANGARLANLTDGGEGTSGHKPTQKQLIALQQGRGRQAYERLSAESKARILAGLGCGRAKTNEWRKTESGQAHQRRLAEIGKHELHRERSITCAQCHKEFITRSAKARCCSRLCEQRHRRARGQANA